MCQQVTILGDTLAEDDESFTVMASVASPDIIAPPTAVSVTIMDDDGAMKHLYLDLLLNNHIIV